MHIGFITPEYPSVHFKGKIGGIGTFTKNLAEELIKLENTVSIFIYSQNENKVFKEDGITFYFVQKKKIPFFTWLSNRKYFNKYVNSMVKNKSIDILEAPEWTGFTAFMKFSCPLVIRLHGSDTYFCDLENRKVKFKNKFFEKRALLGATKIVAVSNFVGLKTKELFNISNNIKTIYNAIDTSFFKPNHNSVKPKSLLYFGTIIRKKGVLKIAEAFNKIVEIDNEVSLKLVGNDNLDFLTKRSTLELFRELLSKKALKNFTYMKSMQQESLKKEIHQAEVILLPSFAEAFPMAWLEAMALEKKIITSNIGWAKELMIDGETGFTVNPNDINDFKEKTIRLLKNNNTTSAMGQNARKKIVSSFNINEKVILNLNYYKKILNEI
ncbi:glycosyltransferase family 4 protein [Polaribacter batillariae]|uniref:Glycosyltransferase family 4 protein n=1 Tax=Polaribacter batillariae TaxID=2808900 RepID=A0ABX7STJ0_9FLAO|nr:glycosyltransferase family 4 protein [Polaribacter batillariae]QTD37570.1 glycosyltransferase family 4 protein [Polaribacter batillariae]